ncbi:MAG: VCBS repeat-containing protein [Acidobacteria bacterium]|nr:VCBS repeat-containing protein [Acidobacteriota bacterium]
MRISTIVGRVTFLFAVAAIFTVSAFAQAGLHKALDFDGDGKADDSIFRPSTTTWWIRLSETGSLKTQVMGIANQDFITPGDFDGDGIGDLAIWRDTSGMWYWIRSSDNTAHAAQFGVSGDQPVARDYDGDGKTDPAIVRRSNGLMTWYVNRSTDLGYHAVPFGSATDFAAPGDYDGDGKFDFAVQRPGSTQYAAALFYVSFASGGYSVTPWGFGTDLIVPGDYDGDGKTDIAVVREGTTSNSPLTWYIRRSSDGGLTAVQWGATGMDLTVQSDYDGDGKTDIAVWRNPSGTYYIYRSSNLTMDVRVWGTPNDFPLAAHDTH